MTTEDRLIEIESRLAYQEDTLQQFNRVLCDQQRQLDELTSRCEQLAIKLNSLSKLALPHEPSDETPPHY